MTLAERLQEQHEDLLDGITDPVPVLSGVPREGFRAFERFAVGMDQFKRYVQ